MVEIEYTFGNSSLSSLAFHCVASYIHISLYATIALFCPIEGWGPWGRYILMNGPPRFVKHGQSIWQSDIYQQYVGWCMVIVDDGLCMCLFLLLFLFTIGVSVGGGCGCCCCGCRRVVAVIIIDLFSLFLYILYILLNTNK